MLIYLYYINWKLINILINSFDKKELRLISFKFREQKDYGKLREEIVDFVNSHFMDYFV